jgi:hypothetical protein
MDECIASESQSRPKYKWGAEPLNVDQQTADRSFGAVEACFGKRWLESGQAHRVQKVWARKDFLAGLELLFLGSAIDCLKDLNASKLKELIKQVKRGGLTSHGFLYEIQALAMLVNGGHDVVPTPKATSGYDADVRFAGGITLRYSFKNHDLSEHEQKFRSQCERLYVRLRAQASTGALERLMVFADSPLEHDDFVVIEKSMRSLELGREVSIRPHVYVELTRHAASNGEAPFAFDAKSTQLTVVARHHPNEQRNFLKKLRVAAKNIEKYCPRTTGFANVVLMRIHHTADTPTLHSAARDLLMERDCSLDAVVLHQPMVARSDDSWSLVHHAQLAVGAGFPSNCPVNLVLSGAAVSARPTPFSLSIDGVRTELSGQYVFQRGVHVREGIVNGGLSSLRAPAMGIHEQAAFGIGGQRMLVSARHPEQDELFLI